jgi:hypothetical protein
MRKIAALVLALAFAAAPTFAHCDALDGPVVTAARKALASEDVNLVMPWVRPGDEPAVRQAFDRALKIRKLNSEAGELADTWFFETVVRIHRAGEGAPYDGLKPAGRDPGAAITAAERAIGSGSGEELAGMLSKAVRAGLHSRYHRVLERRDYSSSDVKAGREYVAAYVDFIHYAERLHQAASSGHGAPEHEH